MPTGIYQRDVRRIGESVKPVRGDKNVHNCHNLKLTNIQRLASGEIPVYIFKDYENGTMNIKIGLEFFQVTFCPFCGRDL